MRVALVNLTSGGLSGGYRKYLEIVPPLIARHPDVTHLEVSSPESMKHRLSDDIPEWRWPSNDGRHRYRALRDRLREYRPDIVFIPTSRIVRTPFPTVVMVRNMEPLVAPFAGNSLSDIARNLARRVATRASCARADRVIAVSDFVRDFLTTKWRVPEEKVGVVPHGIEPPLPLQACTQPMKIPTSRFDKTLFTAGSIRPARGLEDAILALESLQTRGINAALLVAGQVSGDVIAYYRGLCQFIEARGLGDRVFWLGALSRAEMGWGFANCDAFVMTSRVEACPNTALEALSYGALCVATTNRPMPETFRDAAVYYTAGDSAGLADTLAEQLNATASERATVVIRAKARAATYSWQRTVDDTIVQFHRAIESANARARAR